MSPRDEACKILLSCRFVLCALHDAIFAFANYLTKTRQTNVSSVSWLVHRASDLKFYVQLYYILLDKDVNEEGSDEDRQDYLDLTGGFISLLQCVRAGFIDIFKIKSLEEKQTHSRL